MSLKWDHVIGEKPPNPIRETEEENRTRESIDEKPSNLMRKCKRKTKRSWISSMKKTFQPGLRTEKEKPMVCGERKDFGR